MTDLLKPKQLGLWPGAAERMWILDLLAWRMLWHRVGYGNDCCCRGYGLWDQKTPRHCVWQDVEYPELCEFPSLYPLRNTNGQPLIRAMWMSRDGFGRFVRLRRYLWKPDVDQWLEWYVKHIEATNSAAAIKLLSSEATDAV